MHISTSGHQLSNVALPLRWRLIYHMKSPCIHYSPMMFMQLHVSLRARNYTCVHLDLNCPTGPSHSNDSSFTTRNRHVYITAPCLLCSSRCTHELHIMPISTSKPNLSKVALPLRWRLIYYMKSPCVRYSPMIFIQLQVSARAPYYAFWYI